MSRLTVSALALAAAASTLLAAQPADAFCRALVRKSVTECDQACGAELLTYWNTRTLKWAMWKDSSSSTIQSDLSWDDVKAAMEQSANTWSNLSCADGGSSDLAFQFTGPVTDFKTGFDSGPGCTGTNTNLIIFHEHACSEAGFVPAGDDCVAHDSCSEKYNCWGRENNTEGPIALTTTTYDNETGQFVDGDMEFNASLDSNGDPVNRFTLNDSTTACATTKLSEADCAGTDIRNAATHEWGHFLGLAHSMDTEATMYFSAQNGEMKKRDLAPDDIAAICAMYPKGKQTAWCKAPAVPTCGESSGNGNKKTGFLGLCSATGGVDLVALAVVASVLRRRRRFQDKNL